MPSFQRPFRLAIFSKLIFVLVSFVVVASADEFPRFKAITLDPQIGNVCYAVTVADVDGDQRPDIVAVTENRVVWFKAPELLEDITKPEKWKSHTIIENKTEKDNVCIAAHDIDGDGKIDFALGAGWTRKGTLQWLSRGTTLAEPWEVHPIGKELWLHRVSFADVLGRGKKQLVISALNRTTAKGARLIAFEIPQHPKTDRWTANLIDDESFDRLHNHTHFDFDKSKGSSRVETVVANKTGMIIKSLKASKWHSQRLSDQPAGEVKFGKLADGKTFVAAIEPMHGNKVAVYVAPGEKKQKDFELNWKRTEIENEMAGGHALVTADLTGDGVDEIVVGHRLPAKGKIKGPGLFVYHLRPNPTDQPGMYWVKQVVDNGGIAVEDAVCHDINGDGMIDIIAGGRSTRNLKLYLNLGKDR